MKKQLLAIWASIITVANGQGTFIYDQQSSDESNGGLSFVGIQDYQPVGQSFTPNLSSVGFVRLHLHDFVESNGVGATVFVNLRSNSITGPVLASTEPVFMPDRFGHLFNTGFTNFFFLNPVQVTPGVTYYFEPVVQSGDSWIVSGDIFNYPGGMIYVRGTSYPGTDMWFREGIFVPEPSAAALLLVGFAITRVSGGFGRLRKLK